MIRRLLIPALALGTLGTTTAQAAEHVWRTGDGFTIPVADLDLNDGRDRTRLLQRLDRATAEICRDVAPRIRRSACAQTAADTAIASAPGRVRETILVARQEQTNLRLARR